MPLHTRSRPVCAEAFCPIYDTTRQNFGSMIPRFYDVTSGRFHVYSFYVFFTCPIPMIVQWREDSKIIEASAENDFRFQRLLGMVCTMESKEMILPR